MTYDTQIQLAPGADRRSSPSSRMPTVGFLTECVVIRHRDMTLELRQSQDSDVPSIRILVNQAYRELSEMGLNYTAAYQDEQITRERIAKGRAFVLLLNSEIVGTVLFSSKNYFTNRKTGYVSQLAISPRLKRSGLGSLLMDCCEHLATIESFEGIQLDTAKPAQHLVDWYLQRGYVIVGETRWEGKTYESWIFEKLLN